MIGLLFCYYILVAIFAHISWLAYQSCGAVFRSLCCSLPFFQGCGISFILGICEAGRGYSSCFGVLTWVLGLCSFSVSCCRCLRLFSLVWLLGTYPCGFLSKDVGKSLLCVFSWYGLWMAFSVLLFHAFYGISGVECKSVIAMPGLWLPGYTLVRGVIVIRYYKTMCSELNYWCLVSFYWFEFLAVFLPKLYLMGAPVTRFQSYSVASCSILQLAVAACASWG